MSELKEGDLVKPTNNKLHEYGILNEEGEYLCTLRDGMHVCRMNSGALEAWNYVLTKPEPKFVPYSFETVPDNLTGRINKGTDGGYFHVNVFDSGFWWISSGLEALMMSWEEAFEELEHFDGSPFGVEMKA